MLIRLIPLLVGQRTLLVWGESFLYASHRDTVRAAVPGATSEATVEGGRFDLCFERPAEVAAAIVDWL